MHIFQDIGSQPIVLQLVFLFGRSRALHVGTPKASGNKEVVDCLLNAAADLNKPETLAAVNSIDVLFPLVG